MIGTKFEVGKEYVSSTGLRAICRYAFDGNSYHCMFGGVTVPGFSYELGEHSTFSGSSWKEYHEPVVEREIKYLRSSDYGLNHVNTSGWEDIIAKVEVIHTEGVGVEYNVLEYYGSPKS